MDPSKFAGMSWDVWAAHVESENKEQLVFVDSNVNKLKKEDLKIYGHLVDSEPLNLHECEKCGMLIKAQALLQHVSKHTEDESRNTTRGKPLSEASVMEECEITSPMVTSYSGTLIVQDRDFATSDIDIASEKNLTMSPVLIGSKRLKRVEKNRSPLGLMCTNRWYTKKKESRVRIGGREKTLTLLNGKGFLFHEEMDNNVEKKEVKDDVDFLTHQLPEMTLNPAKKEKVSGEDVPENVLPLETSVSFISNPPRALCSTPMFACHKVGGLMYPGRNLKNTRNNMQQMLDEDRFPPSLLSRIRRRRKTPFDRNKHLNNNNG